MLHEAFDPRRLILIPLTAGVSSIRVMSLVSLYHRSSWNEIHYRNGHLLFVATLFTPAALAVTVFFNEQQQPGRK